MESAFTILFYLRKNRVNENGQTPVMSHITIKMPFFIDHVNKSKPSGHVTRRL